MKHRHVAHHGHGPYVFRGPVARREDQNPRAHGGGRYIQLCNCGATREMLLNGQELERGPWEEPREHD